MKKQLHLLPECYADTLLVNRLIQSLSNHKRGISKVFTALKDTFRDRTAVGIIDDDKKKDKYFDEFKVVRDYEFFRYLSHPNGMHYIIAIRGGGIEKLIIKCAEEIGYTHPLIEDIELLKSKSKSITEDVELRKIINTLIQQESPTLLEMRRILLEHVTQ